jgi:hypothetical protein
MIQTGKAPAKLQFTGTPLLFPLSNSLMSSLTDQSFTLTRELNDLVNSKTES